MLQSKQLKLQVRHFPSTQEQSNPRRFPRLCFPFSSDKPRRRREVDRGRGGALPVSYLYQLPDSIKSPSSCGEYVAHPLTASSAWQALHCPWEIVGRDMQSSWVNPVTQLCTDRNLSQRTHTCINQTAAPVWKGHGAESASLPPKFPNANEFISFKNCVRLIIQNSN